MHLMSGGARRATVLARPTHQYLCHSLSKSALSHVLILVSKPKSDSLTDLIAGEKITQLLAKLPVAAKSIVGQNRLTSLDSTVAGGRQCWCDVQGRCFNNAKWTFI